MSKDMLHQSMVSYLDAARNRRIRCLLNGPAGGRGQLASHSPTSTGSSGTTEIRLVRGYRLPDRDAARAEAKGVYLILITMAQPRTIALAADRSERHRHNSTGGAVITAKQRVTLCPSQLIVSVSPATAWVPTRLTSTCVPSHASAAIRHRHS
jgi:hypothetical protein